MFWNSVDLTGNQTICIRVRIIVGFWNSVDLTGNQTIMRAIKLPQRFGTVSI